LNPTRATAIPPVVRAQIEQWHMERKIGSSLHSNLHFPQKHEPLNIGAFSVLLIELVLDFGIGGVNFKIFLL